MLYLLGSSVVVFTIILTVIAHKRQKKQLKELEEKIHIFHSQIETFFTEYLNLKKQYVSESTESIFVSKWQNLYSELAKFHISQKHNEYEEIAHFRKTYANLHDYFETANSQFIQNESIKHDALFSNIDGKSLDEQQRTAVITDEDRILVLAGAGSGKTLTISAKVKYLCEVKNVNPNEILLISFTKKSAEEMTERIRSKLHIPAVATTFHKRGLKRQRLTPL
ncbi:MAG: UvrD-helicase domain-containing protein [Treponema sp.]|nr:UvrD-helicase domain-containing protein [Treponema sp.]